jgi:hypothetical protein
MRLSTLGFKVRGASITEVLRREPPKPRPCSTTLRPPDAPHVAVLHGAVSGFAGVAIWPADKLVEAVDGGRWSRCPHIDGESVACGDEGLALFERIRYRRHDSSVFMWAFDTL